MPLPPTRRAALLAALPAFAHAQSPSLHQVDLFERGFAGVHTYRIPALIETRQGALLAVADARHDNGDDLPGRISLVLRKSTDFGRTWTPQSTLVQVPRGGAGDASLLLDRQGRVWCFYAYGAPGIGFRTAKPGPLTGPDVLQVHAIVSTDGGSSWSRPTDLTPQIRDPRWHAVFATSGTHFVTARGRMIVPLVILDENKAITTRNAWSDDDGRTWKTGPAVAPETDESKAVEIAGGVVLQNVRNGPARLVARSTDGGITFHDARHHESLNDAGCNAGFARYRHGGRDLLLFTNAASTRRENLTIRASADAGRTWPAARVIHPGPAAYSTVLPLRDGSIAVLYERGDASPYERITFARLSPDWLPAP
ncbi:MAG: glycoside hydrolase [Bryobacteraceae bacterium]|nr:exo-alpha-sialidase [Solibacteraceae bacterium]MCO5353870.1 glycoside hydrolase [Bryobacteraceae bacterium]